jgi:CelD/BcsL family acetyltransferase involved in cellulose biosynthesis
VLSHTTQFASLKEEWDDLYESCPSATPFSSWAWLYSWWEVYGEGSYKLRLITLRDEDDLLVGLLPLMARRRLGFGRLLLLGGRSASSEDGMTSYKDVLVREGWEEPVAHAGARALKELEGWRVADLRELMPEAAAWHLLRNWEGPKTSVPLEDYLLIRANSWEELPPSVRRRAKRRVGPYEAPRKTELGASRPVRRKPSEPPARSLPSTVSCYEGGASTPET